MVPGTRMGPRRGARAIAGPRPVPQEEAPQSILRDPYRLLLMVFVVQTVSRVASALGLAALRPALLLFGMCFLYALAIPKQAFTPGFFKATIPRLTLAQAVLACCSALFGLSLGHAATFILNEYWKTLAGCWLLMASLRGVTDVRRMVWAMTFAGFVLAYLSLYVVGISKTQGTGSYDANDIGVIMVMTVPLALLCLQTSGKVGKLVALVGLALTMMTIVKSQSRGAFVGAAVVGLMMLVFLPGVSVFKRVSVVVALIGAMMFAAPTGYWETMNDFVSNPQADYNWDAYSGRRNIAKRGIGYMMQYPIFGVGINNFSFAEGQLSPRAKSGEIVIRWAAPHNSFVQAGAEMGIPGLILWVTIMVMSAGGLWRLRRRMRGWDKGTPDQRFLFLTTLFVPVAFVGFAITATFVSFAWSDEYYLLPVIVVGAYTAHQKLAGGAASGAAPVRRGPK